MELSKINGRKQLELDDLVLSVITTVILIID